MAFRINKPATENFPKAKSKKDKVVNGTENVLP